ncbi:hypothetical protein NPIL_153551 [Nephila pilipes]|uniref:Uncharacterized protein n=1 Tax=Nephila pilipes TaxID=299642 RepID=A0A8X6NA65_NEPPI|nr:hypothetical protein NPIL_153551 [Nephila pilipes]
MEIFRVDLRVQGRPGLAHFLAAQPVGTVCVLSFQTCLLFILLEETVISDVWMLHLLLLSGVLHCQAAFKCDLTGTSHVCLSTRTTTMSQKVPPRSLGCGACHS